MITINLQPIPNQELKLRVGEELYTIGIRTTNEATFISIARNDEKLISNQILIPNETILRNRYNVTNGNFAFESTNNMLPDYTLFGVNQFLYYLTNEDLEA